MTAGRNANKSSDLQRLVVGGLLFGADTGREKAGRSKRGTPTRKRQRQKRKSKANVKNAGWQPFAMLRINLRYDGEFNADGEGGADPSASLRARRRAR